MYTICTSLSCVIFSLWKSNDIGRQETASFSHRAKIGVITPGINSHKHTKTVKKEFDIRTKKGSNTFIRVRNFSLFYIFGLTVASLQNIPAFFLFLCRILFFYRLGEPLPVHAGCVNADFCPVRRTRFLGNRYHYFFIGKRLRTKAESDVQILHFRCFLSGFCLQKFVHIQH